MILLMTIYQWFVMKLYNKGIYICDQQLTSKAKPSNR